VTRLLSIRPVRIRYAGLAATWLLAAAAVLMPKPASPHETLTTTVLFDREIVRILNKHCVMCHAEHGPSFPLETYEETFLRGRKIRSEAIARHMPPWAAVAGYGQFANDNALTLREMQFLVSWVEGLGPRNAGSVFLNVLDTGLPRPKIVRAEPSFGRWQLGEPGLTRELSATTIPPARGDFVARTVVDLALGSERRLRALEYMPGDRRVVRAAFFSLQETGQWLGSWTPWYGTAALPAGAAYRLPAGSHVVAEIHYRSAKEAIVDRGRLGLYFADASATRRPSDLVLEAAGEVPARTTAKRFRAEASMAGETQALAVWPVLQPGVTSIELAMRRPGGATDILLFANKIPLDWPTPYIFTSPVRVPKGSVLSVTAYYDNAAEVPRPGGFKLTVSRQ
jgi:hypothetical protein